MGLDVSFYASATKVEHSPAYPFDDDECWDAHHVLYVSDFPKQADGLEHHSCWVTEGRVAHIHHSYGGYNLFREWLSKTALDVAPEFVWTKPEAYEGKSFVDLINFADNEGTIGPVTAQRLASQFASQRSRIVATNDDMIDRYDEWGTAFALVGETGFVVFR